MILREILKALERIERKLDEGAPSPEGEGWVQQGIDNILGYQAGKKREGEE